jgi:AraC family L-rhamnose operon regulatory protein RhaS
MPIPIYQEQGKSYEADACRPVVAAAQAGQLRHVMLARGHYPGRRLQRNALPGVKTIGYWDADHQQNWGLDWHRNEGIEVTLLESGKLGFALEGQQFHLHAGDLTFTRPWQLHRVGDPNVGAGRLHCLILDVGVRRPHQPWRWPSWIVLTAADLGELTGVLRHNEQPVWHATGELVRCFSRIGAAVEADRQRSSISRLAVDINQLLLLILEMFRRHDVPLDQSLSSTRRTVELFWSDLRQNRDHLALEWTVRGMARRCGVGVTNFTGHTRQLTNMTPIQCLNDYRLSAAAELLKQQRDRSVTDVALACGFASSQYFATLFRRAFGKTPGAFRSDSPEL